jgi:hypothetical protein
MLDCGLAVSAVANTAAYSRPRNGKEFPMKKRIHRIVMMVLCAAVPVIQGISCLPNIGGQM